MANIGGLIMAYKGIKKQLISLCLGEIVASIAFIIALLTFKYNFGLEINLEIIYPFFILLFVLFQGSYYWYYCLKRIGKKSRNTKRFKGFYKQLKLLDLILIIIYPLILVYKVVFLKDLIIRFETTLGLFIYIFTMLEYVNYFYVRLSYNNPNEFISLMKTNNLQKSSLSKKLKR